MEALYVLYDETCGFCCSCAGWLMRQSSFVPLTCLPAGAAQTKHDFPVSDDGRKQELVVIDSEGGVYRDTDAFVMALWALRDWREWSLRLSSGPLRPLARRVFALAGTWRLGLSRLLALKTDAEVAGQLEQFTEPKRCDEGACEVPACRSCGKAVPPGHAFCPRCLVAALSELPTTS